MAEKNVYEIKGVPNYKSQPMIMPFPIEKDREKDVEDNYENWILQNVWFILSQYDLPLNTITFPWDTGSGSGVAIRSNVNNMPDWWWNPSSQMQLNYSYYMQSQPNLDANHLVDNVNSTNRHAMWRRGGRISSIIRKSAAYFLQNIKDVRFGCEPLSPDAVTERDNALKREKLLMLLKPAWEEYIKKMAKMPQQAAEFETPEAVDEWIETKWKDFLADDYLNIVIDNWKRCGWNYLVEEMYLDAKICDCTGIEHLFRNGTKKIILHNPWNLIVDTRYNDPFGTRRRFAGAIEQLTLTEAYYNYPQLDDAQRKDLYEMAIKYNSTGAWNTPNLTWWNYGNSYVNGSWGDMTITNVRVYWIAPEKVGDKDTDIVQTVYTAEILGGKYLMNYGKADNIIENPNNPYLPLLPLFILTPDMKMGQFNSAVTRDRGFQDDYDVLRFKKMEIVGREMGIVAIPTAGKFDADNSILDFVDNAKKYGVAPINTSGQPGNYTDRQKVMDTWDRRLDAVGFQAITQELERISSEMEMNLGATAVSLGENTGYQGKEVYKDSQVAGAMGAYTFDEKMMMFIQMNLDYDINLDKMLYAKGLLKEQALRVVGKEGLWRIQKTKEWWARDFGIYLKMDDKISTAEKKEMFAMILQQRNPQDNFKDSDWLELYNVKTKTQLTDKVKLKEKRGAELRDKQEKAQQQAAQQAQQAQFEHEKSMMAFDKAAGQQKTQTLIAPKQEKLDFERELAGLPPIHPEASQPSQGQPPPQGQPPQQDPKQQPNNPPQ